ncbi:MAG: hypothetical protein BWY93_01920 [Euryarchaeota archaeon ADurb.BinA087]|nr:MAG: hypothetical protein BWY93_01920 [Euryarchaeota archaeon ADurb.BinA087]
MRFLELQLGLVVLYGHFHQLVAGGHACLPSIVDPFPEAVKQTLISFSKLHLLLHRHVKPVGLVSFPEGIDTLQLQVVGGHLCSDPGHGVARGDLSPGIEGLLQRYPRQVSSLKADLQRQPGIHVKYGISVGAHDHFPRLRIDHHIGPQLPGGRVGNLSGQRKLLLNRIMKV